MGMPYQIPMGIFWHGIIIIDSYNPIFRSTVMEKVSSQEKIFPGVDGDIIKSCV